MRSPSQIIETEQPNLWLWIPVLFGCGVVFYFLNSQNFLAEKSVFIALFCCAVFFSFLNRHSYRSLIYIACATFLLGSFYANFYENFFLNHTKITGKVYVDVVGKVESVRKFSNPINHLEGANLVISQPILYKSKFVKKKKIKKVKKAKKKKHTVTLSLSKGDSSPKLKSPFDKLRVTTKRKKKTPKPKKPISEKTIEKNFLNLDGYQEIDRKFLDFSKNYQQVDWLKIKDRELFPSPPQKISINLVRNFSNISVNDKIAFRALLQPPNKKEFSDDFDFEIDAKAKKIGAYGFAIGEAQILTKSEISNSESWFLFLREKIRDRISAVLSGDEKAIVLAFLIGDQSEISAELLQKIRNSGLAHLLSISGFHLSLAGAIFFISSRFILSRSEYLALHFDLKKIAALLAIFATYFYLKIAASPLPAQRAFLMIFLVFLSLMFHEKINSRRAIMASALLLILYNPFIIFSVSFQLSFISVLVLGVFYEEIKLDFSPKILRYFCEIILLSILIQIATFPFLMHSFQNLALFGFISNVIAIPLTSFLIMPLGFLALFLMPLHLENYALLAMNEGIFLLEKIINFVAAFDYSKLTSPKLPSSGLAISAIGLLIFLLAKSRLRFFGITIFCSGFLTIFLIEKPDLIFEKNQKFFAIYDKKNGLFFSENLKPSKQRQHWMNHFDEKEFKILKSCEEKSCELEVKGKKILVLLKRNKISEICKNDFDLVVNLTAKYQLPACVKAKKKIDNLDFYEEGTREIFLEGKS